MNKEQLCFCIGMAFATLVFLAVIGVAILIDYLEGEKNMENKKTLNGHDITLTEKELRDKKKKVDNYISDIIDAMSDVCVANIETVHYLEDCVSYRIRLELEDQSGTFNLNIVYDNFVMVDVMNAFTKHYSYLVSDVLERKLIIKGFANEN